MPLQGEANIERRQAFEIANAKRQPVSRPALKKDRVQEARRLTALNLHIVLALRRHDAFETCKQFFFSHPFKRHAFIGLVARA